MKKRIYVICFIIIAIIVFVYTYFSVPIHLVDCNIKGNEWYHQVTGNKLYEITCTAYDKTLFGGYINTSVKISSTAENHNGNFLLSFITKIDNNGKMLTKKNCNVECNNEYIKIDFYNHDKKCCETYRFYYSDFES